MRPLTQAGTTVMETTEATAIVARPRQLSLPTRRRLRRPRLLLPPLHQRLLSSTCRLSSRSLWR